MAKKSKTIKIVDSSKSIVKQVIDYFGGQKKLAEVLKVSQSAISHMVKRGYISVHQIYKIEKLSNKRFKCKDMRPDLFQD